MLNLTPALPSILWGICLFSEKPMDSSSSLIPYDWWKGKKVQKDLQSFSGPEGASRGTEGENTSLLSNSNKSWEL